MASSMQIKSVRTSDRGEWERVYQACPWATYFQSPEWGEIWARATDGAVSPRPRRVEFEDGGVAVLPFCGESGGRGWRTRNRMPERSYGGWLAEQPLGATKVALLSELLSERLGDVELQLNPFAPKDGLDALPVYSFEQTLATDLAPGFDAVKKRWSKGHRAAVERAELAGLLVSRAVCLRDWRDYFDVYRETRVRSVEDFEGGLPWALFAELARRSASQVRLWLAHRQGRLAGGALTLHSPSHVALWHTAARAELLDRHPLHLLISTAIQQAAVDGARWFDFALRSDGEAALRLQRGFASCPLRIPVVRSVPLRARAALRTRRWLRMGSAGGP